MINQTSNTALDPIQIALAKPFEDFLVAIESAFERYRHSVAYASNDSRVYPIVLDDDHELMSMTLLESCNEDLPIVAYLELTAAKRLMSKEVVITVRLYDNSKEPTIMDPFKRQYVHIAVPEEDIRSRKWGAKFTGNKFIAAIRLVLWEGAA